MGSGCSKSSIDITAAPKSSEANTLKDPYDTGISSIKESPSHGMSSPIQKDCADDFSSIEKLRMMKIKVMKNNQLQQKAEREAQMAKESSNLTTSAKPAQEIIDNITNFQPISWARGDLIGSGAYGNVYQGLNINTGELIAVKTVRLTGNAEKIQREVQALKLEISLLKELKHLNIVKYIYTDICDDKSGVDIILEFVPGGSVRKLLNKFGAFEEKLVKVYTKQILEGLKYLHINEIMHRDLKCANVLVDNNGVIKLSDFGASKKLSTEILQESFEVSKSLKGSPYWMAPEVASRKGHGKPADIWSIGCVVIEMLTGRPPWSERSKNVKDILEIIANTTKPPHYPDKISSKCKEFLNLCFNLRPENRPTAETLLAHPFLSNGNIVQESIEAANIMKTQISVLNSAVLTSRFCPGLVDKNIDQSINRASDAFREYNTGLYDTGLLQRVSVSGFGQMGSGNSTLNSVNSIKLNGLSMKGSFDMNNLLFMNAHAKTGKIIEEPEEENSLVEQFESPGSNRADRLPPTKSIQGKIFQANNSSNSNTGIDRNAYHMNSYITNSYDSSMSSLSSISPLNPENHVINTIAAQQLREETLRKEEEKKKKKEEDRRLFALELQKEVERKMATATKQI